MSARDAFLVQSRLAVELEAAELPKSGGHTKTAFSHLK